MKILIAGDFKEHENTNFSIDKFSERIRIYDYFMMNFEAPIINEGKIKPIPKAGPCSNNVQSFMPMSLNSKLEYFYSCFLLRIYLKSKSRADEI
jgi:hypothetical protein